MDAQQALQASASYEGMPDQVLSTVQRHVEEMLHGKEQYTLSQAAELAGVDEAFARRFWLTMGFPTITDEEKFRVFTDDDVKAMRQHHALIEDGTLSRETIASLIRAQSHMCDRLVLWQHEALVEHAERVLGLDAITARFWVLDHFTEFSDFLRGQMDYAWRRHLASLLRRSETEASQMSVEDAEDIQLQRALGFVDMVAFTNRSNEMGASELINLIATFEETCRDVIASRGARVVKTIGDAFLYIAGDLITGAEVATSIIEELQAIPGMLPVRASLVWGGVVSRFGDVFGPTVNLASRLVDIAPIGSVLTDQHTAEILRALRLGKYTLVQAGSPSLQGIGTVNAVELRRMPGRDTHSA